MNKKTKKEIKAIYQEIARLDSLIHESKEKPTKEPINSLHDYDVKGETEIKTNIKSPDVIGHEEEIDWNVPCQIVESNIDGCLLLTTDYHNESLFRGVVLYSGKSQYSIGHLSSNWRKDMFTRSVKALKLE